MGLFDDVINAGVRKGIEKAAFVRCSGRDDPEDRCPMNPKYGCNCMYVQYRNLPWWRKLFAIDPIRPLEKDVVDSMIGEAVRNAIIMRKAGP